MDMPYGGDFLDKPAASPARPAGGREPVALITQILSIARRRKGIIAAAIALSVLIGLIITLLMTPQYTATTMIEIQREQGSFINLEGAEPKSLYPDQEFYRTQYGLLQSQALAERVASDMRLADSAAFFEKMKVAAAEKWFEDGKLKPNASTRAQRVRVAGEALLKHFTVNPERDSRLVKIQFTSPDPALSKQVADTWATKFIQLTLERRYEATSYARRFLEERLGQLRSRIDDAESQLVTYAAREGIVNLPSTGGGDKSSPTLGERSLVVDDLASLNQELSKATADRVSAESRLNAPAGQVTEALENQAITSLRQKRAETAADYAKMLVQFEPEYPPAKALKSQLDQLDRAIGAEETRVRSTLRQAYDASRTREQALTARVDQLKSGVLDFRRRSIGYNIIQRDVDTSRQLYDALLQRYKEIGVAGGVGVNNISIVDTAELPRKPSSPRMMLNLLFALLIGTALGVGLAFALEQVDQGVADPAEIEELLGVPLLGMIPRQADGHVMEVLRDRKSVLSEAYVSLRTNLALSTSHGVPRTLAITSTRPAEGKTTTSYALAESLSRGAGRVLLIDGDMRSPSIHHLFDIPNTEGLSNYLSGDDNIDHLIHDSNVPGFKLMTAGPQPPNAADLLSGERWPMLLERMLAEFEHIVVDAPPVMGLADAPLFANGVEGTIFVLEAHSTQRSMAQVAINRLIGARGHVLGAVMTKFNASRANYGYGYDYGYGYGYGAKTSDA